MRPSLALALALLAAPRPALPRTAVPPAPPPIPRIGAAPTIDGVLEEAEWAPALRFEGFRTYAPDFGRLPSEPTEARLMTDGRSLFIGLVCRDGRPDAVKSSVSKRDSIDADDWVKVFLDTAGDGQAAYMLQVNPEGIQGDGIERANGAQDYSLDLVWESRGRRTPEGYAVEIALPFKSLRFPGRREFPVGLGVRRFISRKSERVSFPPIDPRAGSTLSQLQTLVLSDVARERVVELLPAVTRTDRSVRDAGPWRRELGRTDLGLSAKVGVTSDLTAEATVNPDFSHVESDARQLDLNVRAPVFYLEKRPFFQEGVEQFAVGGTFDGSILHGLVHTRTIVDPAFGFKLSGRTGRRNAVTALFALDDATRGSGPAGPFGGGRTAILLLRDKVSLKGDGYLGAIGTAREQGGRFNRAGGLDGRFRLGGADVLDFHVFASSTREPGDASAAAGHAAALRYSHGTGDLEVQASLTDVSRGFVPGSGYIERTGLGRFEFFLGPILHPRSRLIPTMQAFYWGNHSLDHESGLVETSNWLGLAATMPRQTQVMLSAIGRNEVFAGRRFPTSALSLTLRTQPLNALNVQAEVRHGRAIYYAGAPAFGGTQTDLTTAVLVQPAANVSTSLAVLSSRFVRPGGGGKVYSGTFLRSRTLIQVNRFLYFRGIVDYDGERRTAGLDLLGSFTLIPGTVLQAGYGSFYERADGSPLPGWNERPDPRWDRTKKGFFFKASYLWRW